MHDMNCGLKAYRGDCARSLELYGEMHRFLPVLAAQQGWRVAELPVNHRLAGTAARGSARSVTYEARSTCSRCCSSGATNTGPCTFSAASGWC